MCWNSGLYTFATLLTGVSKQTQGPVGVCLIRILAADVVPTLVQDMESRENLWRSVVCQDS